MTSREAIESAIIVLESEKLSDPTKVALVWAALKKALEEEDPLYTAAPRMFSYLDCRAKMCRDREAADLVRLARGGE